MQRRTVLGIILCLIVRGKSIPVVVLDLDVEDSSLFSQVLNSFQISNVPRERLLSKKRIPFRSLPDQRFPE